jgi:hypothetical protein
MSLEGLVAQQVKISSERSFWGASYLQTSGDQSRKNFCSKI